MPDPLHDDRNGDAAGHVAERPSSPEHAEVAIGKPFRQPPHGKQQSVEPAGQQKQGGAGQKGGD